MILEVVINYLKSKLDALEVFIESHGLCEVHTIKNGMTMPGEFCGEFQPINYDFTKSLYFFLENSPVYIRPDMAESIDPNKPYQERIWKIRLICYGKRKDFGGQYAPEQFAQKLISSLTVNNERDLRLLLKSDAVYINPIGYDKDWEAILKKIYKGVKYAPSYEVDLIIALDLEISIKGQADCFNISC